MKKNLIIAILLIVSLVLGIISVATSIKLNQLGTKPVAPNVPSSKPKAQETIPLGLTPATGCKLSITVITVAPTPTGTIRPTPTGTRIPTPTNTPQPSPTPEPTATPTTGQSGCDYLDADVTSGLASLTVNFAGKGNDSARIKGFRFSFGDGEKQQFLGSFTNEHVQEVTHTYSSGGEYLAVLEVLDNGDHWRTREECKVTIEVTGTVPTPTTKTTFREIQSTPTPVSVAVKPTKVPTLIPTPTEVQLPKAGLKVPTIGGILGGFLLLSVGLALIF